MIAHTNVSFSSISVVSGATFWNPYAQDCENA